MSFSLKPGDVIKTSWNPPLVQADSLKTLKNITKSEVYVVIGHMHSPLVDFEEILYIFGPGGFGFVLAKYFEKAL